MSKVNVRKPVKTKTNNTDLALMVTPLSNDEIVEWDKNKISESLEQELNIDIKLAREIANNIEEKITGSKLKTISTTLIRELIDNELFEKGLNKKLKKHQTYGLPLSDLKNIIYSKNEENSNILSNNPEAINLAIAEHTLKQFALDNIFSQDVATAHLEGKIHLHDLGYPRCYCSAHSPAYILKYGLSLCNLDTESAPAKHAHTLTGHINTFLASMQAYYAGALGLSYVNIFYAPLLEKMTYKQIKQEAQYLIFSSAQTAFSRGNQAAFLDFNIHTGIPNNLKNIKAIGKGGKILDKTYKSYENIAIKFAKAMLEVWEAGDKNGTPFTFPKLDFHCSEETFKNKKQLELFEYACKVASKNGSVYFIFDREDVILSACCRLREEIKDKYMIEHPESLRFSFPRYESIIIKIKEKIRCVTFENLFEMVESPIIIEEKGFEVKYCNDLKIWDLKGWSKLSRVIRHKKGNKILRNINTSNGLCITATEDHPIPCSTSNSNIICKKCKSKNIYHYGNTNLNKKIVYCLDCKKYSTYKINKNIYNLTELKKIEKNDFLNYIKIPYINKKYIPTFNNGKNMSSNIAYIIGGYIGDGHLQKNSISFSFGKKKLENFIIVLNEEKIKYSIYKDRNSFRLVINNKKLADFLRSSKVANISPLKQLPWDILNWNENIVKYLIAGIIDTDGNIHRKAIEIGNTSKAVLSQIQILLQSKGFYSSLNRRTTVKPNMYNGRLIKQKLAFFILNIPCTKNLKEWFSCSFKIKKLKKTSSYMEDKKRRREDCIVKQNNRILDKAEKWVYDITTSSGTFSLNGIQVHNCGFQNVTINLPQAAYRTDKNNVEMLIKEIKKMMDLVVKAHLQKKRFIQRLMSKPNMPLWELGKKGKDNRPYVDLEQATYIIGIIGLNECVQYLTGKELHEDKEVFRIGLKIIVAMNFYCKQLSKELKLSFKLEESPGESSSRRFAKIDANNFPKESKDIIKGNKDLDESYYTNSVHLRADCDIDLITRIEEQSKFHGLIESGAIIHAFVGEKLPSAESISNLVKKTWDNTNCSQLVISPEFTVCNDCKKIGLGLKSECQSCGSSNVEGITRIVGYYSRIKNWNKSKLGELKDRQKGSYGV